MHQGDGFPPSGSAAGAAGHVAGLRPARRFSSALRRSVRLVRARIVVPVGAPPVADGAVAIAGGVIRAVGRWRDLRGRARGQVVDLGEVALMPGWVNAHCHLDYTDMAGQLVPPRSFTDWIKCITELKAGWSRDDFVRSWQNGARMLLNSGTTLVGDIECAPDLLPEMWQRTPLRVVSFLEMTGVRSRRQPDVILDETLERIRALPRGRHQAFLSPHAPYSTTPGLLRQSEMVSRRRRWPLSTHVAESAEEYAMFKWRRGPMFAWLARNERDMADCGGVSPVQHLDRLGFLSDRLLAVHVNYLARGDADVLARRRVHVVHCPRSHEYFGHRAFPVAALLRRGVNVCLGTDSLATVLKTRRQAVSLDMGAEMRAFASAHPGVAPVAILRMATTNGARALGLAGRAGELRSGAWADLMAVPYTGGIRGLSAAVVHGGQSIIATMIDGAWITGPAVCGDGEGI